MYEEVNSLKIINVQQTLTGVDLSFIYFYVKNELSVNSVVNTDERTFVYTYNDQLLEYLNNKLKYLSRWPS